MHTEDLLTHRLTTVPPAPAGLEQLALAAQGAGYTEDGLRDLLGVPDVPFLQFREIPGYLWRCRREGSGRATLAALWLLGQKVPRPDVERALGAEVTRALLDAGLLAALADGLVARTDLYPCEGVHVLTDRVLSPLKYPSHVYELGEDSYMLARTTPRRRVGRALDLCTGSGIHAVLAADHADRVVAVDRNPRALEFGRLNAALNGRTDRCEFRLGDLWAPVAGETFDLVTVNPPFVPTPNRTMPAYRTGGEGGEDVVEAIFRRLAAHLAPGGTFAMVTNYPLLRDSHFLERIAAWLGSADEWGTTLLHFADVPLGFFVTRHLGFTGDSAEYTREFQSWLDSYERHGIVGMAIGVVLIRRLRTAWGGWSEERRLPMPTGGVLATAGPWLDSRETYGDPAWRPAADWRPALGPQVAAVRVDVRTGVGQVEFAEAGWSRPAPLSAGAAALAGRLDGRFTAGELAEGDDSVVGHLRELGAAHALG